MIIFNKKNGLLVLLTLVTLCGSLQVISGNRQSSNKQIVRKVLNALKKGDDTAIKKLVLEGNQKGMTPDSIIKQGMLTISSEKEDITKDLLFDMAVIYTCTEAVEDLMSHGFNINKKLFNNKKPLEIAIWRKNLRITKLLIENGADYKSNIYDLIELTLQKGMRDGQFSIFEYLIKNCCSNVNKPILHTDAILDTDGIVTGFKETSTTLICIAIEKAVGYGAELEGNENNMESIRLLLEYGAIDKNMYNKLDRSKRLYNDIFNLLGNRHNIYITHKNNFNTCDKFFDCSMRYN